MAALGPNVDSNVDRPAEVTLAQIAATIAEAVGQDFRADHPTAALPLPIFNHLRRGEGK